MEKHNHHHCQTTALARAKAVCAARGLALTKHRQQVFEILWQSHQALTAADIMAKLGNSQPPITYRALAFLTAQGLVHKITSLNAYVGCSHAQKPQQTCQMLICIHCKTVTERAPKMALQALLNEASTTGFQPAHTHIEMLGLCQACAPAAP